MILNEDLLEILRRKEDFNELKFYVYQTQFEKYINLIIEHLDKELNKIFNQIFV